MINEVEKKHCTGCGLCVAVCPKKCISMESDAEGFLYPNINCNICIGCNLCEKYCHALEVHKDDSYSIKTFAAYNKDDNVRMKSSSGGIFYSLARYIIYLGGVVYGVVIKNNEIVHDRAVSLDEVDAMLGSKYVQSRIEIDIYQQIKKDLEEGRYVLFSGTPCQCGAVKHYAQTMDFERLVIVSFICHGVPSPSVWKKYINWQTNLNGADIKRISFRDKTIGWTRFSMAIDFTDGKRYQKPLDKDYFLKAFLKNNCLRESCYHCQYKGKEHYVDIDIMLADWWGAENSQLLSNSKDKGISAVFLNSDKGEEFWNAIVEEMYYQKISFERTSASNVAYNYSAKEGKNRKQFMKNLDNITFDRLVNKYCKTPVINIIKKETIKIIYLCAKTTGILKIYKRVRD